MPCFCVYEEFGEGNSGNEAALGRERDIFKYFVGYCDGSTSWNNLNEGNLVQRSYIIYASFGNYMYKTVIHRRINAKIYNIA